MTDYYSILKVTPKASNAEIKSAYRRLARRLHPDKNNGSEDTARQFAAIAEAYEILGNPKERARYDQRRLQAKYDADGDAESVFASSNTHAQRWRKLVYEHRYNEIIDRMIADERRESIALQRVLFPIVALFLSTLMVAVFKPQIFANSAVIGKIVVLSLFAAGVIHLWGRLRDVIDRYTYDRDSLHDSILDDTDRGFKPYSRVFVGLVLFGGLLASFGIGLAIGNYVEAVSGAVPVFISKELKAEFVLYPPIFVLLVDAVHGFASRSEAA